MLNFLKGMLIGCANVVPGVSGGTIALLVGIYERMVSSISALTQRGERKLPHLFFLVTVLLGMFAGVLIFARLFTFLLSEVPFHTYLFLMGLIAGSVPLIAREQEDMELKLDRVILLLIGFVAVALLSIIGSRMSDGIEVVDSSNILGIVEITTIEPAYALWLFLCGFLAIGAMMIPGFSGSALLVALGEYSALLYFLNELMVVPLIFFSLGAVLGVFLFARIIDHFLKTQPQRTYYLILGLVAGSILEVLLEASTFPINAASIVVGGIVAIAGALSAYGLGKLRS
ncbi:MAG: DUF368 domain-containing protein [Candidatus Thermoplasmatota archaeon]|nr:DUF368 domain-containing protein [Candidatus Thermoplasmatota archaeon]